MTALLKFIPWWAWAGLAILAALAVQELRIRWVTADRDSVSAKYASTAAKAESLENTLRLQRELTADRDAIDRQYTEALAHAQAQNDQLRADLAAGRKRVHVNAVCVPSDTGASGSADAGTPRLTPDAEQARTDLEYAVEQQRQQIIGLQAYIKRLLARLNSQE